MDQNCNKPIKFLHWPNEFCRTLIASNDTTFVDVAEKVSDLEGGPTNLPTIDTTHVTSFKVAGENTKHTSYPKPLRIHQPTDSKGPPFPTDLSRELALM